MKYIDAERLKAKLDEHYRKYQSKYMETRTPYTQGLIDALDLAEQLIDSLQQEQPEVFDTIAFQKGVQEGRRLERDEPVTDCHDLEGAAIDFADYARKALYSKDYAISSIADYDHGCIDGFKAGAKWGANHLRDTKKKVSEDLEEAAKKYDEEHMIENGCGVCHNIYEVTAEDAFKAGAEWQKRKQPKVKGYGVMRKMEDPHPDDWYMDERGKEHCWGYKFNEPCPWPAEVYIMEAKEDGKCCL